ncbi:MAG: hypothetical protein OXD34_15905 [bacterium]|nr:hypothetical protein [bacterium]
MDTTKRLRKALDHITKGWVQLADLTDELSGLPVHPALFAAVRKAEQAAEAANHASLHAHQVSRTLDI